MEKRGTRSSKYQYLLLESAYSNDMMESFCNEDSISSRLNPFEYSERLIDLEDQLKREFWRIVDTMLTKRQKEIVRLSAEGLTQSEIAKKLDINQSSVSKCLLGNTLYHKSKSIYGGAKRKIQKIIETDDKIKEILQKMMEVRNEKW